MADRRDDNIIDAEVEPVRTSFRDHLGASPQFKQRLPKARTWFGALLIVLMVVAAGAIVWFRQSGDNAAVASAARADSVRIAALERKLGDMDTAVRADLRQIDQRLKALEAKPAGDATDPAALDTLRQQVDELHKQIDGNAQHLGDIDSKLGGVTDAAAGLGQRLGTVESKIAAENGDRIVAAQRAVAFALALGQLREAAHSGPYAAELNSLVRIDPAMNDDAKAAVQGLDKFAPAGVPTVAQLQARFPAVIPTLFATEADNDSFMDKVLSRLRGIVTIRRTGEVEGKDQDAVVARTERRVQDGNLAAALDELATLPQVANEPAAGWINDAKNRVSVDAALKQLDSAALARLSEIPNGAPRNP